jgi:hypothetical protein
MSKNLKNKWTTADNYEKMWQNLNYDTIVTIHRQLAETVMATQKRWNDEFGNDFTENPDDYDQEDIKEERALNKQMVKARAKYEAFMFHLTAIMEHIEKNKIEPTGKN